VTQPAERGELRSTAPFLAELVSRIARVVSIERHQAMPIHRLVFHPTFGFPRAAANPRVRAAVAALERLAERVVPHWSWYYIHVRGLRPQTPRSR
jgi:hypothetical protein